jgi:putative hydrolase of the HAD superfamily
MACTVYWEPGCERGGIREAMHRGLKRVHNLLAELGYSIDLQKLLDQYVSVSRECRSGGRECWHLYRIHMVFARLGIEARPLLVHRAYKEFVAGVVSGFQLPSRHRRLVEELRAQGYTVVLATEAGSHDIPLGVLEATSSTELYDAVVSSHMVGWTKDTPRFYEELVKLVGSEPSRMLHVGDSLEKDYISARRAGIASVLYSPGGCPKDVDACVERLDDLLPILR